MNEDLINYGALIDDAMHVIVKKALEIAAERGLPGDHHFFVSFLTRYPGVKISEKLLNKYPDEMTIVLQYQFEELKIEEHCFSVILSFNSIKEKILVPYAALTAFADPSVKFGLQFRHIDEFSEEDTPIAEVKEFVSPEEIDLDPKPKKTASRKKKSAEAEKNSTHSNNVITLETFRNKPPRK